MHTRENHGRLKHIGNVAILFVVALLMAKHRPAFQRGLKSGKGNSLRIKSSAGFLPTASDGSIVVENDSVNGGDTEEQAVSLSKDDVVKCYNRLFNSQRSKMKQDYDADRPVVNSIRLDKDGNVVAFLSFKRSAQMTSDVNKVYMESKWFCDNDRTEAFVYRHEFRTKVTNLKMVCPPGTTLRIYLDPAANQPNVSYDVKPFLECDRKLPAILPPEKDANGEPAHIVACTQVKYPMNMDLVSNFVEKQTK